MLNLTVYSDISINELILRLKAVLKNLFTVAVAYIILQ